MHRYAIIGENGVVLTPVIRSYKDSSLVEIPANVSVAAGWHWDGKVFTAPAPVPEVIRIISRRAFFERLPDGVAVLINESTNPNVKKVNIGMNLSNYVDLDSYPAIHDLGELMLAGMITDVQMVGMLVDGKIYEKYNGVL